MSTYCRITGRSRGLPKPNYFPLLPPISPADAKRLCRITGKSYGLPTHHYLPVLVAFTKHSKTACHITANAETTELHHVVGAGVKHTILKDYRYVFPVLETNPDLLQMLESKPSELSNNKYVYTVDERRCSLVFPGRLEAAVRDGDVRDIMLATHADTLLLKLRKGGSVEVDVKDLSFDEGMELYEGEGPSQEVLQRRRKRAAKNRSDSNDWRRKIFEDKERQADFEEERLSEIKSKRIKVKLDAIKESPNLCSWNNVREGLIELHADPEFDRTVGETILQFGKQDLQNFINVPGAPIISTLPQCLKVQTENVDLSVSVPGIIKQPITIGEQVIGFPVGAVIAPFHPLVAVTDEAIDNAIHVFNASKDELKEILVKQLDLQAQYSDILPLIQQVPDLAQQLETLIGTKQETRTEFGVKLALESGSKYVPGQFFDTPSGPTFVPGNIVETSMGPCFVAGFSVNTAEGVKFLPGRIVKEDQQPVFVAGQMAVTREGEKFVQGQMVCTKEGPKFIPGQTVITSEGVKFVPGQVIHNAEDQSCKFVPGQTIMTPEGPQFVSGQFTQCNEQTIFVPGQAVLNENYNWEFIPGKNMKTDDGTFVFVPGKEIVNELGTSQFVPGRMIIENGSTERFLPGLTVDDGEGNMRFVPGMQLETPEGIKFVEGMVIKSDDGDLITFAVGKVSSSSADSTMIEFDCAKTTDDIVMHDILSNFGMCFSSTLAAEGINETEVFGHMIQSAEGVEFFPGDATGLPAGKVIPGKLIKGKEMRFIPGTMIDNKFIPGQFVTTGSEEKFIPGQVIETNEGPKFVPGQVLHTTSGPKFVPGQTMETEDGPKFIPGQIIETKSGPTFIPGQVIYTEEEGSRFVPGQVVDTIEGPRFVPGRVVETGDHVTFIPGQIVETEDGLKFIAPDLEDDLEGGYQFTVQGFEVAQEELKMIQRNSIPYACFVGEMAIDSQTLHHLAQAGMAVGRQLPVDVPVVDIKSLPTTEMACKIANKLDLDVLYSVKLSHILSTLQQACQSGVALTSREIGNETLAQLLNVASECNSSSGLLETLGNALEGIIKQDMANKLQAIDGLHTFSVELAATVRDKKPSKILLLKNIMQGIVDEKSQVIDKLMIVLNGHSSTVSTVFQNLSQHNPEFVDEVLENVSNILKNNADLKDDKEVMEVLHRAIIKSVNETSTKPGSKSTKSKAQKALSSKVKNNIQLLVKSCQVAKNLDVDELHSVKLSDILSNIQQVHQSYVPLTNKEVGDGNLMQLLNLALQCDGNANLLETLGNALENVIKQENGDTLQVINDLHKLSSKLVAKVRHKKPNKVLMLKDIMKGNVEDRDEVIEKLVAALNDHETNVSAAFQHLSLQNPEFVNQVLENASDLLKNIVDVKNEKEAMEILQRAVIKTVAETSKNAATKTNKSKSQKTSSSEGSNEVDLLVKSSQVASKLRVDVLHSAKLSNILSTLQQVRQSHVAFTDEEIGDENLVQLLNLALECDSNSSLLETLGDALENVIKEGGYDKVKTINELCTSSAQLAAKIHNKKPNKVLLLKNIIKGDIEDKSEMVDTLMAMLNEQEATVTGAFHHLSLYTPDFVDKVLENASHMIDGLVDVKDEKQAMDILHKAIIKTITETGIKPGTMINKSKSQKALSRKGSKDVELLVTSSQVADNLDIDMLHSVKLSHILSSLQQIRQSHVAFTNEEVGDENVAQLLNLALECDNNSDVLETLSTALEKVIKEGTGDKIKTINDLCAISVALAAKVHDKKPNKVLLLKSVIKGNVEEKSEMVDKLVAMLNEQEATVTGAFQHLSIQIPDFVDKVLENASHMLDSLVDVKDEKQAMEILHRAIIKTIAETGVKPSLKNNKSKTQKAQTSKGGNDVELLVKSSQVANNLDVDILHSVKLSHILSSLQQVRQSYVDVPTGEVKDENLRQLLNLALECDINDSLLETLGAALENVIKQDKGDKLDIINNLHTLSIELAAKVCDKKPNKVLLLKNIVKGNVEEKTEVVDKLVAMLNDNETAVAAAFQHLSLQTPEFVDKVIENASHMLDGLINVKDEKEAIKILNKAIIKTISETSKKASSKSSKSKLQQALCSQENDNVHSLVKSCQVAKKLNLDAEHSVKLCQLLSTLQQVHQSYVPLTNEEVGDEKLMQLLNLALQCDTNSELLETLGDALETIFKKEPGDKLKAIDDLHTLSVELAANVCNKKPDKVLLLKNMVKGNVKGKGEVANKLVAMLSDHETSMSAAFQHLSSLNPEFAEKVLENASIILRSSADIKDEKEAMEVVHQAIMKAVIKTSMKPGSKTNKLKLQQALSSEESNDVHLLVKSCQVANNLDVDASHSVKLNRILSNLQQVRQSNVALTSEEVGDENLMQLLNLALECDTIPDLLETVGDALENIIKQDIGDKSKVIDDLHALSVELAVKARNKKPNKVLLLRNMINGQKEEKSQLVERLIAMLNDHETTVCVAFQHMCQQDPEFVDKVLENTAAMLKTIVDKEDEKEVMETLHRAIIKTVAETSESKVQQALLNKKGNDFNLLVKDAISLAKALGMCEVVNILNEVIKDRNSVQVLAKDTIVMEVLKRLTVMRQLAESRPNLVKALKDLHSDPYAARSDPRLRELVRESAMLMVIPEESLIKSSADIPSSIMFSDNCLAVEDFMVKTRQCGKTFLILKKGIQAVIPREAAKDVLTGRVPYTMLDENGIHYFKPLHVFNALKLPKVATNRFHNYTYIHPALLDDDSSSGTRGSSISTEDLRKTLPNGHGHHSPHHHEGMDEEFVLVKDFVTDDEEFYADKGERVKVLKTDDDDPTLMEMEVSRKVEKTMLLDCSTARYKMSIRPPRKHADSRLRDGAAVINGTQGLLVQITDDTTRSGLVPMDYLKKVPSSRTHTPDSALHLRSKKQEAKFNREVCIGELIETEEEFGKDISRVVESYLTPLEEELRPAPRSVMDNKDTIFNNLSKISTFHNGVMIAGVKYFLKEPKTIGRTLLRLERYFDEHAQYVKYEPDAQELLEKNEEIQNYFDDLGQELGDDKSLSDHLKLPIQRINDYTLLLQELIKYSRILGEDITDLERALELMLWIPTRCNDLKFITNIEGFHGNIHKLGRLIRHNWFLVKDKNSNRGRERYCFLFKARFLICKVRRISEDRVVFVLKEIIKLPEVDVKNNPSDKRSFEIHHKEGEYRNYPYTFTAHEDDVKPDWLREIQEHAKDPLTLAEHTADDLKLQSQAEEDPFEPLKGVELDISPDIEQGLDPIEKRLAHRPLKHVPEPKRPPLVIPKKRTPIFVCEDPSPSPEREPEPVPEPEPEPEMISSYTYEEYSYQEEVHVETVEEPEEECEEVIEFTGKRKPKYIPGVSRPLFHSTIRGSSNEPGDNAVFECEVEGVTSMTWLKDNRPLSDKLADRICITQEGNVYRLEIKNVSETDSGTYTARAENDIGVSYSTAHLIVEKLSDEEKKARAKATSPVFLVQLKDAELLESTHARFLVKVNGNPIPEIQFYKGDQLITADNEHIEIVKDGAHPGFYEMVIADVRPEDAGEYKCVASNKYSDETCSCIVTVTSEKDIFAGLQDDLSGGTPKFMWLKNGKPFSPEERFKVIFKDEEDSLALVFQNVKPEDAGLYTCVASTSHGKISCSAELTVQGQIKEVEKLPKKAKIESITKTFEGNVGSTTVIEVKATGDPLPQIRWFREGEEIVSGGRFKVLYEEETESASLVIKNLCLEDTGEYNIVAKNSAGTDSQFVNLTVKAPPKINKKLEDFTGLTGKELRLTVQVDASPKPIVQWYKDGMTIVKSSRFKYVTDEASDSYTLVIENATMDDAGLYSVVASNEFSQVSDRCHVSMESPPQFVSTITKELETLEGDYVSFTVTVEGDPLPAVKWKFNGKEIKHDGKHYKISSEDATFTLLISEVDREDAGMYSCEISNQWGSNECDGHLYVKCLPRFDKDLEDRKVKEGDCDVEFTLKLNAFPKATVKWFHDEAEITSKKKEYTIVEEGDTLKLIIKEATTKMSGIYKCRAENEVGFKETTAKLSVCTFPKFKKELSDVDVKEGETLKLTIQCAGVPEPEVKWFKDGEELYSDSRIKISRDAKRIENYHLTITLIKSEDGGEYEVRATNEMGTAVTKSLVTVLASTNHSTLTRSEQDEQIIPNGDQEVTKTEVEECKVADEQVKDQVTVKLPVRRKPSVEKTEKQEPNKSDKTPLRKRLSSEAADEETFSVRELRSEEFVAAAEMKPSSFGVVEEPPENEHYIKINISRGVSIVSISEDENPEDSNVNADLNVSKKSSTNVYELNEEDELNLEMNEKISRSNSREGIIKRHSSKTGEDLLNEINRKLSAAEGESKIDIISYDSSRKSSMIEESDVKPAQKAALLERQQSKVAEIEERIIARKSSLKSMSSFDDTARKPTKAVSFDEQPSRIIDSGEDDGCEELFKRIQTQRSILGEILEKQQESQNKELEERRSRRRSRELSQADIPEEPKSVTETALEKPKRADSYEVVEAEEKRQKYAEKSKPTEDSLDASKQGKSFEASDLKRKSIDESKSPLEQTPRTSRRASALDLEEKIDKSVPDPEKAEVTESKTSQRGSSFDTKDAPEAEKPTVEEPKTPQRGRSFEIAEKTDESAETPTRRRFSRTSSIKTAESEEPEEKSTPRTLSRASSIKTAEPEEPSTPRRFSRASSIKTEEPEEPSTPRRFSRASSIKNADAEEPSTPKRLSRASSIKTAEPEEPSTPRRLSRTSSIKTAEVEEAAEKSTPRRLSRSSSSKPDESDESKSPAKAELLDVSEKLDKEKDEPKSVSETKPKTPQRGRSVEIKELAEKSEEPTKPSEQKLKTPSRGVSQDITDADEVMFEKSESKTPKVSDLDKTPSQKAEEGETQKKGDESDAKRTIKRMPTERSSTLESVPDLSMDDEKASKSKRASLAEVKEAKGEYPRILSGMEKDIDTFETLSAAFEVVGFGVPRPTAIWYKNGEELNDSKHFAMTEDGDKYKLEISDLKSIDAGVYSVKLENSIGETSQEAKLIISNVENLRGPKLREGLKKTTVTKRQKGVLEATFVADPVPEAKWTVDDRDVNAEFNVKVKDIELGLKECTYTMTIPSTELSDTGTYKVKVTNKHGSTDSSASLTIVMEPEIDTFRDLVVPPTMPCTFEVIVKSTPEATVTWYANGKEITEEGQKFKITSEKVDEYRTVHRLSIEDCSLPDEGEYKILAKNKVGSNSQVASLKLYTEKPSFVKLLEDKSVQDGDQLQMKVRINGLPKPDVKWYKNGEEIESSDHMKIEISTEGQLSTSLTIDHFSECDVDEYKVTAKNLVGEIETSAKLTMALIEPSFGETLKRVTEVSDGEPLEISTKVMGSPIPVVQWFKDGEEIKPENTRIKSSVSPKGDVKLNIDKVDLNDCGAYKAVATNALGKSIANTAVVVNQAPKKPSFIKNLSDVTVVEGEPIKLEAQVAAFPEPRVKWLKDGHQIHPCPQYDFISAPNGIYGLTIERSTIPDLGQYSIVVSNKCGDETSNSVVRVTPADKAPAFQTQLQPTKVVEGYPAKLEVKVTGFPLPKLTWKCNGQPIKIDNENVKIVSTPEGAHCLLIEKVTKDHTGEYELVASNDIGDNSTKAQLTVASRSNSEAENEKPIFLSGLRDTSVDESSVLSMSAPFRGNPIPDVQWFKDGTLLLPDERIHFTCDGYKVGLEIQDVNMADTGFYSCALKNPYGEDSSAAHVGVRKLYQSPVFTQRFKHQQQLPKHDAKFHCRVTGVPFPSVMWHCNGLPLSNSNKIQIRRDGDVCCLTVFNVNLDDEGTYSCIASNREGTATCEAQLQVVDKIDTTPKQEPPQFMKKIGDCEIYAGMTAKFTACASGVPEPEYEWFLDNIRIHPNDRLEMEKEGSGLVRLKILASNPDLDTGTYKLRAFNPHGEVFCEAKIIFDSGLEMKHRKPVGELYRDFDKFRATGAPLPLADKPIISRMTDRHLTLSWKPSIPISPREPVTYLVEMEEQPNGKWFTARAGIRSCACDIHNLKPFVDYKFRVRVENNYGISDPSPFAITYREKLEPDPPKIRTHLLPGAQFHPDTAHYFPKDFDIERPPHDNYAQAPKFLRQEYDTQYGVKGHNVNLFWFVYGYPKPKMTYYFNDELIEMGGRYDSSYTRNGQATLFINKMLDRDVGVYEAVAVNEHGTARQRVQLRIAEYPEFLKRPEESWVPLRKTCRLEARVIGVPYPEIKWYKDWQPLGPSSRIQIDQVEPDLCILRITDLITKDEGLYSISARNIAGSISTSVYLHVEESDYDTIVGGKKGEVKTRNKKFDDIYDLGDELGRGTQGITFHAVERNTGKNLAAKVMHGTGDLRKWMSNELDILNHLNHRNIIRPYDSLITSNSFTIIEELGAGGELLDVLTRKTYITEYEISFYIRQLLLALDHMHEFNIAHLGITPGDLLISHLGGDHLKLTDFGLSRRINSRKLEPLFYGMPEFVAPEVAGGEGVNLSADMWSVGVITHLLLTGVSLFRGKHDVDTLDRIKEGRYSIDTQISDDARDFIIKLLTINSNSRLDVRQALNHRWIKMAENLSPPPDSRQINTENLRNYYNHYKDWYSNASCRTWFRRRTFDSAYRDPSRMIYPPGLGYSPAPSPEPQLHKDMNHDHKSWKDRIPSREPLDVDIGLIKNESHYQYGPDTYLLQLRDVDFPVRLREYMKVAKSTSDHIDWQAPVIRERRRFMDVMDEEIDDEQKARINQYGSADIYTLRRLKQELGARPTAHVEAEAILGSRIDGLPPFFREKPQTIPIEVDKPAELVCYAVGSPKPLVQWFKNDLVITENHRIKIFEDNQGRSILRLDPANDYDLGIYKVVARNKFGQTTARARMVIASEPGPPEPPEVCDVSDTEVLLKWKQPKEDGNTPVLCYGLQILENEKGPWKTLAENIDHEAWLVHDLVSSSEYQFRLLAMNKIGWSIPGFPTIAVTTKFAGAEKLNVPHVLRNLQIVCERGKEIIGEEPPTIPDYSLEHKHIQWCEQPSEDKYRFVSEIARGRFSIIVKGIDSSTSKVIVAKLMEINAQTEPEIEREFEIYRMMRHERIANLAEAFKLQYSSVAIFIMEKLQGADVLTYLTSRHDYSEQMVATIITQVLDALQYLHWKGYCHLNLQPDNVVMASVRSLHIKLIDFSCAQHVNKLGTVVMNKGPLEYTAPEVLCDEPAFQYSDIWSVGVLTYILLSGVSPFRGFTELETRQNITFVRYRFEHLYKDLSQEALRFLMMLFKRTPTKRPSAEECHEQRWLLPTEYLIKKREKTSFETTKLKKFSDEYHLKKSAESTKSKELESVIGGRLTRSNSIVEELEILNTAR
ncbi:uncharacterized protein LOC135848732 isoform X2 [Planococcus citri]|uniref:uncharacterized protein LOC135848732 isoform X2 n=1 Tax=Planococcus citri TaxID=170843 RepID=UPI0031FA3845